MEAHKFPFFSSPCVAHAYPAWVDKKEVVEVTLLFVCFLCVFLLRQLFIPIMKMITLHCLPEGESLDFNYYHLVIMYTLLNAQVETIVYLLLNKFISI